jgi:hypothetical protein
MAKTQTDDPKTEPQDAIKQRRPSDEFLDLRFKMPRDFVRRFKQEALNREMKLNELFRALFDAAA